MYLVALTATMKFGKEGKGMWQMVNNFIEGVDVDEFLPKLCGEGGPRSQITLRLEGAGSPHQCPAAGEGLCCCANTMRGWDRP